MPLLQGKQNIGKNIKTEQDAGKPHRQAIAIALSVARKTGGNVPNRSFIHKKSKLKMY